MKSCKKVMTKQIIWCLPNDSVEKAANLMKSENIGSLPVLENDQTKKVVGLVTDRDLTLRVVAGGLDAKSTKVESVMTHQIITCRANDDIRKALEAMSANQVRRIPIVNKANKILGIIAQADVAMQIKHPKRTAKMMRGISQENGK
ncbi:MAG: CBS domain-containing protein [Anaerolineales bacterium]|nr:CBS domain-containing protein [Anaerolineales bacterium]